MGLVWNQYALLGAIPAAISFALAAVVYHAAAHRAANRRLAIALALYGVVFASEATLARITTSAADAYAATIVADAAVLALLPCYLLFLATLETPLVKPLASRSGTNLLRGLAVALPLAFVLEPTVLIAGVEPGRMFPFSVVLGPWYPAYRLFQLAVVLFGFATALSAYRSAPRGAVAKQRAGIYAIAFGLHDALWVCQFVLVVVVLPSISITEGVYRWWEVEFMLFRAIVPTLFALLLAWGMLRWHLFDLDFKIKRGISRSTLAAIFLAVFILVAEVGQNWLGDTQGYLVGGVAATAMLLAIRPLERVADRVANAAMPDVTASPEYFAYRKLQVYRATLEGAREDGAITPKERALLDALARELGIRPEDARAVEADSAAPHT